jgi:hypothetical protein
MTRTNHSLPNHNARSTISEPTNNNYSIPSIPFPNGMIVQSSSLIPKTVPPPAFNVADNTLIPFPHINDFLASNNNQPVIINGPAAETKATQSLTQHTLIFTSQPTNTDPPKIIPKAKKHQPNANNSALLIRPKQIPLSDPKFIQPRPDKKTKVTGLNPTQTLCDPIAQLETEEVMEVPGEKKRRREEEKASSTITNGDNSHFLMAGPGSQACRDQ